MLSFASSDLPRFFPLSCGFSDTFCRSHHITCGRCPQVRKSRSRTQEKFRIVHFTYPNSINSCLYASISYKTSVFIGFSRPYFLFLSPTTPFLHHFTLNYTFSRTFPFPRTACPLLRGNTSPLSFVMCHVPKVSAMFWGSCHIRLLL